MHLSLMDVLSVWAHPFLTMTTLLLDRFGIGSVVGWLPSEISEFMSAKTNEPAALWRIVFDEAHKSDVVHT